VWIYVCVCVCVCLCVCVCVRVCVCGPLGLPCLHNSFIFIKTGTPHIKLCSLTHRLQEQPRARMQSHPITENGPFQNKPKKKWCTWLRQLLYSWWMINLIATFTFCFLLYRWCKTKLECIYCYSHMFVCFLHLCCIFTHTFLQLLFSLMAIFINPYYMIFLQSTISNYSFFNSNGAKSSPALLNHQFNTQTYLKSPVILLTSPRKSYNHIILVYKVPPNYCENKESHWTFKPDIILFG